MVRIGICDDEQWVRLNLRSTLERLLERQDIPCNSFEFSSGEGLLKWLSKHPGELDVLFLDIEMRGITGMETARKIRETDDMLILVFVTGFSDYVFDGYTVGAIDYLMKPPDGKRLEDVMSKVLGTIQKREPETYTVQNADGLYRVPMNHILYFSSDRRMVNLITKERTYSFYAKLDEVEQQLNQNFVRIHRRYLIRAGAVQGIEGNDVLIAGEKLPISRNQRQEAMLAISQALLHKGGR